MAFLQDIKIIDMRRSGIPREEWQKLALSKAFAPHKDKLKYVPEDYKKDASIRPDWKFWWCRNTPKDIEDWLFKFNSIPVEPTDGYIPTLARLNESNQFQFGDLILMKISLEDWISKRRVELDEARVQDKAELRQFDALAAQHGARLSDEEKADRGLVNE